MTRVLISAEVERWTSRSRNPDDSWDQGDTRGEVKNVWGVVAEDVNPDAYWGESGVFELDAHLFPGDTVYAVVADYESGSTFGRDGGHSQILDVFLNLEEAVALREAAKNLNSGYSFTHHGVEYHASWMGYFERLQELDVWKITLRPQAKDPYTGSTVGLAIREGH